MYFDKKLIIESVLSIQIPPKWKWKVAQYAVKKGAISYGEIMGY